MITWSYAAGTTSLASIDLVAGRHDQRDAGLERAAHGDVLDVRVVHLAAGLGPVPGSRGPRRLRLATSIG